MPAMIRPNNKARRIVEDIFGKQPEKKKKNEQTYVDEKVRMSVVVPRLNG